MNDRPIPLTSTSPCLCPPWNVSIGSRSVSPSLGFDIVGLFSWGFGHSDTQEIAHPQDVAASLWAWGDNRPIGPPAVNAMRCVSFAVIEPEVDARGVLDLAQVKFEWAWEVSGYLTPQIDAKGPPERTGDLRIIPPLTELRIDLSVTP